MMKNKTVEQLAKEYRKTTPNQMYGDELGFIAGFSAKEDVIKETLETLRQLAIDIDSLPPVEQIFKSRDLDRLKNKIEVLSSLL